MSTGRALRLATFLSSTTLLPRIIANRSSIPYYPHQIRHFSTGTRHNGQRPTFKEYNDELISRHIAEKYAASSDGTITKMFVMFGALTIVLRWWKSDIETKVDKMEAKVEKIDEKVDKLGEKVDKLGEMVDKLGADLQEIKKYILNKR